jgi:WD40 repeat protein
MACEWTIRVAPPLLVAAAIGLVAWAGMLRACAADEPPRRRPGPGEPPGAGRAAPPQIRPRLVLDQGDTANAVDFSPDSKTLAVACGNDDRDRQEGPGLVVLWDVATGRRLADMRGLYMAAYSVAFSPDGKTLASGGYCGSLALWDVATRRLRADLIKCPPDPSLPPGQFPPDQPVWSLAFGPDGKTLAFLCQRDRVRSWDLTAGRERPAWILPADHEVRAIRYAGRRDGLTTVVQRRSGARIFEPGALGLWRAGASDPLWTRPIKGHASVGLSPDGTRLAMSASTGFQTEEAASEGRLLDARDGKDVAELPSRFVIQAIAFSPDGRFLATDERGAPPDEAPIVRLRDAHSGRELAAFTNTQAGLWRISFSPDGKTLSAWGHDSTVRLWDVAEILARGAMQAP